MQNSDDDEDVVGGGGCDKPASCTARRLDMKRKRVLTRKFIKTTKY
jgi:ActR/RegA family two-component response regulator